MFSCQKSPSRAARFIWFCLLLMWGVTLSSSTSVRSQSTRIESIPDEIKRNNPATTRELDDGGVPPEVPGNDPSPGTGNPGSEVSNSGILPANNNPAPQPDACVAADVDSCDACKNAAEVLTENGKTCWWERDSSSCIKTDLEGHTVETMCDPPEIPPPETNPCANADIYTCAACQAAASSVTENDQTCLWENGTCSKARTERDSGNMCVVDTAAPAVSPTPEVSPKDPTTLSPTPAIPQQPGFGVATIVGFLFFGIVVVLAVRNASFIRNLIPADAGLQSAKRSGRYQEISTDEHDKDEEWGWDDEPSTGSGLELNSFNQKKDDEHSAHSVSEQEPARGVARPISFPKQNNNLIHRTSSGDRDHFPSPISSPKAEPPAMRALKLTSAKPVKKAQPPVKKAQPPPKPKQDDIFAEMGFSAKPTFSHAPPVATRQAVPNSSPLPVSGNGSRWQPGTTTPVTGSLSRPTTTTATLGASALTADSDDDLGDGADWDDDADLDDLLDD